MFTVRSTSPESRKPRRAALVAALAVGALALAALAACGSSTSSNDASHSTPSASTATSGATQADCSSAALLAAVPGGATMEHYDCANAGGQEWAAVEVNPGNTVFFLQWNGTKWDAETSSDVCGTASAGVPSELLSYCGTPSPAPSPSPVAAPCSSRALLAALPGGATMKEFDCANAGGEEWAAARVDPGNTVFFLQRSGTKWNAVTSSDVCGTASAGVPAKLLSYCKG